METCTACLIKIINGFSQAPPVTPDSTRLCGLCIEPGASKRKCCNALYCDHCYTKDRLCPNCNATTKREEKSGATYIINTFSEHEECRICLDPGLKRKCCGNYFCDDCYYSQPKCRSCGTKVGMKGLGFINRASWVAVLLGWLTSLFISLVALSFFLTLSVSEIQMPKGISSYSCDGFFRQCSVSVCVDLQQSVANGSAAFPPISTWRACDLNSTIKAITSACIFDPQLFTATDSVLGYDICESEFSPGVYILEDNFEHWEVSTVFTSNKLKSALWLNIVNGEAAPHCGVAKFQGGKDALVFGGPDQRFAETIDLDMRFGGWLEAELFLSPAGWDVSNPRCRSNYAGTVEVEYSIDRGASWTLLFRFEAFVWRSEDFFPVKFDIPDAGATEFTRFRFNQPLFAAGMDQWALDNVRVFRKLDTNWNSRSDFIDNVQAGHHQMQTAQCCFDTDWCDHRLSPEEMTECHKLPWYKARKYLLRNAEMVICLAALVGVIKFIYVSSQDWLISERYPFQDEIEEYVNLEPFFALLPPRYRPKRDVHKYLANIHSLARLDQNMREHLDEEEGSGLRQLTLEEIQAAKLKKKARRDKAKKKKLEKRDKYLSMKTKHAAAHAAALDAEEDSVDTSSDEEEKKDPEKFAEDGVADAIEKLKRSNLGMLRTPFDLRVSLLWQQFFACTAIGLLVLFFIFQLSTTKLYTIYEQVQPLDLHSGEVLLNSYIINFVAFFCDLKEVYYALRHVVPIKKSWTPMVTLDRTEDVQSLFLGRHCIPLERIESIHIFSAGFATLCGLGYLVAVFPWALATLVLRNQYVGYPKMRILTPVLGGVVVSRALLGPAVFVKIAFFLYYFFAFNMFTRERIGIACQAEKTRTSAFNFALAFAFLAGLLTMVVAYPWTIRMVFLGLTFGFFYGALTGWVHELPIHPMLHLTTLDGGMYLVVKKKQQCPCVYWGSYCTEIHDFSEVVIFFTEDDVKFVNTLKGGANVVL